MEHQNFITKVLKETSTIAKAGFGKVNGTVKPDDNNQVLTETDLKIGSIIIKRITKKFPKHNIIDEEAGVINNNSEFTWVIDPIDGTSNYANGIPLYGIMIGLLNGDIPIAGGIALPNFSELYYAEKGKGAYCNGEKIKVSRETNLLNALVAYGIDGHRKNPEFTRDECSLLADIILNIRSLRVSGGAFDLAMVAKGKYDAFLNRSSKIWDNMAQQIIIEEAGGVYTDFFGNTMDYSNAITKSEDNYTFFAAPPELHKKLLNIISSFSISNTKAL